MEKRKGDAGEILMEERKEKQISGDWGSGDG